uniref:Uncharacterized protein n=1 Tax=Magnetococcus massalia (strain MO-1) TaxID=451514 RepID=A0A1S7LLA3_MAGMO|nr:conserved protein of unknown function [Candidatus Magnetococcus massalia]
MTDEEMKDRILALLQPKREGDESRVMAYTMFYRKLFGRQPDKLQEERLQQILNSLEEEGKIQRYPDIGVAEPPYVAC